MHPTFFRFVFSFRLSYHQLRIAFEEYIFGYHGSLDLESCQYGLVLCLIVGGRELKPYSIFEGFPFRSIDNDPNPSSFMN